MIRVWRQKVVDEVAVGESVGVAASLEKIADVADPVRALEGDLLDIGVSIDREILVVAAVGGRRHVRGVGRFRNRAQAGI
ncbi:MAG: hypothetical protein WBV06_02235 [Acidimicrobiia bacterium]